MASNLARLERLDLEYQDILEFQNMRKEDNKLQKEASLEVNHSGEASIVVMKPLGHQTTTPIPTALSPLHQTRDVENMPSWDGSRKSTVTLTPHAGSYREKSSESSESSSNEYVSLSFWLVSAHLVLSCGFTKNLTLYLFCLVCYVCVFSIYFGAGEGSETKSSLWINIRQILHRLNCDTNPCLTCYFAHVADVNMQCSFLLAFMVMNLL
jgi:hypothetical protein